jgi:hypothetical protein
MTVDRTKNATIIINKEDVNNPVHTALWETWLEWMKVDPEATEICVSRDDTQALNINIYPEDISNPLHPNLWEDWKETLGYGEFDVCLNVVISNLDHNKKVS